MYLAPKKLRRGSRIAIVAPASSIHPDQLSEGLDIIREIGLIPVLGPCVKNLRSINEFSAPLQDRVDELNWAFKAQEISAVICALGGLGSASTLPHLDYDVIRASRKPFLGRSDITALNSGILKHAGLITFNCQTPSIKLDAGENYRISQSQSFIKTLELLMSDQNWGSAPFSNNPFVPRTVNGGFTQGLAMGGNADTFTRLIGTPHLYDLEGSILFIEDVHKSAEGIAREFLHMKLAGILDMVAGVVIGEFQDEKKAEGPSIEEVIQEYFYNGPPCVYGYPFSHGPIVAPIPIGASCTLDADSCEVSFDFCMS
jgi:muramoyltetrapeptide carboxypeptidase